MFNRYAAAQCRGKNQKVPMNELDVELKASEFRRLLDEFCDQIESAPICAAVILRREHAAEISAFTRVFDALGCIRASKDGD
jgi:hypothetical protein